MLKFTHKYNGWEITEKGQILFSRIKSLNEALAIARVYGGVLTSKDQNERVA